jgi:hypothetical protein
LYLAQIGNHLSQRFLLRKEEIRFNAALRGRSQGQQAKRLPTDSQHVGCRNRKLIAPGLSFDSAPLEYQEVGPGSKERAHTTTQ